MQGLRIKDSPTESLIKPCDDKKVTRWIRIAESGGCDTATPFDSATAATIAAAIKDSGTGLGSGTNPNIRDIDLSAYAAATSGSACNSPNANLHVGAHVVVDGAECWLHSHSQEQNVYDFSGWAISHPGTATAHKAKRPNPITKFAMDGETELNFPSWHEMKRWDDGLPKLLFVGRNGDNVDFATLPFLLQTEEMATRLGANSQAEPLGFEACGSRNEVANDPSLGNRYVTQDGQEAVRDDFDQYFRGFDQAAMVWSSTVINADDQLRQRMAWSLSQIVVVSQNGFGLEDFVETWANYYDILVHHALGNYRNILREVSASPLMGRYLTFLGNEAFARNQKYPDENYVRTVYAEMQLYCFVFGFPFSPFFSNRHALPRVSRLCPPSHTALPFRDHRMIVPTYADVKHFPVLKNKMFV